MNDKLTKRFNAGELTAYFSAKAVPENGAMILTVADGDSTRDIRATSFTASGRPDEQLVWRGRETELRGIRLQQRPSKLLTLTLN